MLRPALSLNSTKAFSWRWLLSSLCRGLLRQIPFVVITNSFKSGPSGSSRPGESKLLLRVVYSLVVESETKWETLGCSTVQVIHSIVDPLPKLSFDRKRNARRSCCREKRPVFCSVSLLAQNPIVLPLPVLILAFSRYLRHAGPPIPADRWHCISIDVYGNLMGENNRLRSRQSPSISYDNDERPHWQALVFLPGRPGRNRKDFSSWKFTHAQATGMEEKVCSFSLMNCASENELLLLRLFRARGIFSEWIRSRQWTVSKWQKIYFEKLFRLESRVVLGEAPSYWVRASSLVSIVVVVASSRDQCVQLLKSLVHPSVAWRRCQGERRNKEERKNKIKNTSPSLLLGFSSCRSRRSSGSRDCQSLIKRPSNALRGPALWWDPRRLSVSLYFKSEFNRD